MRPISKFFLRLWRSSSGSVWLEAAIMVPIAISLMVGVVDFGWGVFSAYATASKSVREAARYMGGLALQTATGCPSWAVTNTQNLAVYGNIAGSGSALVTGWQVNGGTNNNVNVDCSTLSIILVTAKVPYNPLIIPSFMPLPSTVTLSVQHTEPSVP
jgi:Flp pilus assembly protein TadG